MRIGPARVANVHDLLANLDAPAEATAGARVPVLLPLALRQTYDYVLGEDMTAAPGAFVLVSFGPQARVGIVWDVPFEAADKPPRGGKLKRCLLYTSPSPRD